MSQGSASGMQSSNYTQRPFGGTGAGMGMGMGAYARPMNGTPIQQQQVANGKQKVEAFDEAAFEAAFEQAQRDMLGEAETNIEGAQRMNTTAEVAHNEQGSHRDVQATKDFDKLQDYQEQLITLEQRNAERKATIAALQDQADQNSIAQVNFYVPGQHTDTSFVAVEPLPETDPVLLRIQEKRPCKSLQSTIV